MDDFIKKYENMQNNLIQKNDKIPNRALAVLMNTKLSNLALVCLVYLVRYANNTEPFRVELADMRRSLGYGDAHGTYYRHIRAALAELDGTFLHFEESEAPVAASVAGKEGRNVVFSVILNPIFFDFSKNEKGQNCNFTSLPKLSDLPALRAKYHMRAVFLALRWQSGGVVPTMSLNDFRQWFSMPNKWKPSEVLNALVCAQRIVTSLGVSLFFTLDARKKSIQITAKKSQKISITNESATAYRKRNRRERKETRAYALTQKLRSIDVELANFARASADKYRGKTFELSWLHGLIVKIEAGTGLLVTTSGKYLSESNNKRFYTALIAKEG